MATSKNEGELKIVTPIGMLGYGFNEDLLWEALEGGVDAIIADSGSTDSGPQKLALGHTTVTREGYEHDLNLLLAACHVHRVTILIGSAGGDGANDHVDFFVDIMRDLISKKGYRAMKIVSIYSEIDKSLVKSKLECGQVVPCSKAVPLLKSSDIDDTTRIVAQMGLEPYVKAMEENPDFDIIVGGRAYDPSPYAAFCVHRGFPDLGIAYHMGKIMECGALCAVPKSQSAMATIRKNSFDIVPLDPAARCTVTSVAAHTLYEKTRPDILVGPGGTLYLEHATYEALEDNRTVRVRGGKFVAADPYTVKLEGARVLGYRTTFFGGIRDPILISQLDQFLSNIRDYVRSRVSHEFDLRFHQYGRNAVMGELEPTSTVPKEICLCGEVLASTQAQATYVSSIARLACIHGPYLHQLATAGNFAMPFPPYDIPMGEVCEFSVYHILEEIDPVEFFPIHHQVLPGTGIFAREVVKRVVDEKSGSLASKAAAVMTRSLEKRPFLKPDLPEGYCYLGDIASVIRTKNAGPYELTMDVMFDNEDLFQRVKKSGVLCLESILKLYGVSQEEVLACLFWDQARSFKATIKRPCVSGQFGDIDMHGSQQHTPLMYIEVPIGIDWAEANQGGNIMLKHDG
ncbi:hypothetical protein N7466_001254 [Penicillium verhagenii]|uniref:uncharacterized protein n=1 Tax=Penicillium verhagenii TaxID=1562060 RepID=UPI002545A809|nr:uncharacterized protein N7466_001254 [Penicillium verhagenii]KAJ5948239.1 hypothetical protein N7466_001254 [Penicillium verhagenii]